MLKTSNAVISGSLVLRILLPCSWASNDMDIYCGCGTVCPVIEFLQHYGYGTEVPSASVDRAGDPSSRYLDLRSIKHIYTLRNISRGTSIDIIESIFPSCVAPILEFHSTPVMNWMAHDGVVCLYPHLTAANKGVQFSFSQSVSSLFP
ncbi:hypothetical protein BKA70DRAFT_1119269 [Coprinopsis sp. MPI-PUGE-AT-0042]|nr:hypothetical protein BKA70DRAFT_1119269 [Coprinopsis sp. MPI-PUGE-AT-0042]